MLEKIKQHIRTFPDFPKAGVLFRDITPLLAEPEAMDMVADLFAEHFKDIDIDVIAGIDSRGFIFGTLLAQSWRKPLALVRKSGKLPGNTFQASYELEYGHATIEVQEDTFKPGQKVLLVDDLLATGNTLLAAANLVERSQAEVVAMAALIELTSLKGRDLLSNYRVDCLLIEE